MWKATIGSLADNFSFHQNLRTVAGEDVVAVLEKQLVDRAETKKNSAVHSFYVPVADSGCINNGKVNKWYSFSSKTYLMVEIQN